jgi:hypothetical protein
LTNKHFLWDSSTCDVRSADISERTLDDLVQGASAPLGADSNSATARSTPFNSQARTVGLSDSSRSPPNRIEPDGSRGQIAAPHRQCDRQLIPARHVSTRQIDNRPGQPENGNSAEVSDRSPRALTEALGKCATISASGRHVFRVMRAALSCQDPQFCLMRIFISHARQDQAAVEALHARRSGGAYLCLLG